MKVKASSMGTSPRKIELELTSDGWLNATADGLTTKSPRMQNLNFLCRKVGFGEKILPVHVGDVYSALIADFSQDTCGFRLKRHPQSPVPLFYKGTECGSLICETNKQKITGVTPIGLLDEADPAAHLPSESASISTSPAERAANGKQNKGRPKSPAPESDPTEEQKKEPIKNLALHVDEHNILIARFLNSEQGVARFLNSLTGNELAPRAFKIDGTHVLDAAKSGDEYLLTAAKGVRFIIDGLICYAARVKIRSDKKRAEYLLAEGLREKLIE